MATSNGLPRKTNKAQLGRELEKLVQPTAEIPSRSVYVIDGMALIQKLKVSDQMTFGQIADAALSRVLQEGGNSRRIDVVFDVYNEISIKSAERERREEGESVTYKNLTAGQKIKQFRNFLQNGQNKNSLIAFFNDYWRKPPSREKLASKELYTTCGTKCYKLTADTVQEVIELSSGQEEADTRLLLHAKHAATSHVKAVIISSEDTDVRILCISFAHAITVPIYQRCVSQHQARYVDISKIAGVLGQEVSKALLGLHAFTGCDSVSAFAGIGKAKPLRLLRSKNEFQVMFQNPWGTVVYYRRTVCPARVVCVCYVRDEERQSGCQSVLVRGFLLQKRQGRITSTTTLSRLPAPSLQESQLPDRSLEERTHQQPSSRSGWLWMGSRK